jgi:hypothetical protein
MYIKINTIEFVSLENVFNINLTTSIVYYIIEIVLLTNFGQSLF